MTTNLPDANDLGELRDAAAISCAGALCNPGDAIGDYGDFDEDHSEADHLAADGRGEDPAENAINFFTSQQQDTITIK